MDRRVWLTLPLSATALAAAWLAPSLFPSAPGAIAAVTPTEPAEVEGPVAVRATVDRTHTDAVDREVRVRVELDVATVDGRERAPTDVFLVIDESGSMGGTKIEDARAATEALMAAMRPDDRLAVVTFESTAELVAPLSHPTDELRSRIVGSIQAAGGTNMAAGLELARAMARVEPGRAARMVLMSDGHPQQTADQLVPLVGRVSAADVPVTAVGIGRDWDETLMRSLADAGAGNLRWVERGDDLQLALAEELSTTATVVAQGADLRVDGPARILGAAGYPQNADGSIHLGSLAGGSHRGLWVTLRLTGDAVGDVDLGELRVTTRDLDGNPTVHRVDLPVVHVEKDAAAAYAALGDDWARGVVQEHWNEVRQNVSVRVQRGDANGALAELDAYQQRYQLLNGYAANPIMDDNIDDAAVLAAELRSVIAQADSDLTNGWSKGNMIGSTTARKGGP